MTTTMITASNIHAGMKIAYDGRNGRTEADIVSIADHPLAPGFKIARGKVSGRDEEDLTFQNDQRVELVSIGDWNRVKDLARKVARQHGMRVKTRGLARTERMHIEGVGMTKVYRGDPVPVDKNNACYYLDFDSSNGEELVQKVVDAMRETGLRVLWTGKTCHAIQLFV